MERSSASLAGTPALGENAAKVAASARCVADPVLQNPSPTLLDYMKSNLYKVVLTRPMPSHGQKV